MASIAAGDILGCTYAGRELFIVSESSVEIILGGFTNEVKLASRAKPFISRKYQKGSVSGLSVLVVDQEGVLEFLQSKANTGDTYPFVLTLNSGIKYSGDLVITGEIKKSSGDGNCEITLEGALVEAI